MNGIWESIRSLNKLWGRRGLVLTEALLAVAMIGIAAVVVSGIVQSGIDTTKLSRGYLQAQNLATEAIEGLKSVRNSNWLLKPNDSSCWLSLGGLCGVGKVVQPDSSYILIPSGGGRFTLQFVSTDLDLRNYIGNMRPYWLDKDNDDGFERYFPGSGIPVESRSAFYRSIKALGPGDGTRMDFEVKVEWKEGNKVLSLSRDFSLYNYQ